MVGCFKWVLRVLVRILGEKGGWFEWCWMFRCVVLFRVWILVFVWLEMVSLIGVIEFSCFVVFCGDRVVGGGVRSLG